MTKTEFLDRLKLLINDYPGEETEKSLEYYSEIIDDRIEEGMSEDEAVGSLGSVESIANQIKSELPLLTIVKQKAKERRSVKKTPVWLIILLILGSPLWIPIVLSVFIVVASIYISFWSVILAFWIVDAALFLCCIATVFAAVVMLIKGAILSSLIYVGITLLLLGISIFGLIGCFYASKGLVHLFALIFKQIKKALVGKKEA